MKWYLQTLIAIGISIILILIYVKYSTEWVLIILIVVAIPVFTFLIYSMEKPKRGELAKTVSIVGFLLTVITLVGGVYTYFENIKRQNTVSAYGIYQEFMKVSIDSKNDNYRAGKTYAKLDPQNLSVDQTLKYEEYQWYVGSSLFQFESILALEDPGWDETFESFIDSHRKYISNDIGENRFPCERYSPKIKELVNKVTKRICPDKAPTKN
jgi:hypothetical protein